MAALAPWDAEGQADAVGDDAVLAAGSGAGGFGPPKWADHRESTGKGGSRDPPPAWDGVNPAKRWLDKKRELQMWADDTECPKDKMGVRFWRLGLPEGSPARTLVDSMSDEDIRGPAGFDNMIFMFDRAYAGFLKVKQERTFEEALYGTAKSATQSWA